MGDPYYEIHVVVADASDSIGRDAKSVGAWWSMLDHDTSEEERPGDAIVTSRADTEEDARAAVVRMTFGLRMCGHRVTRAKIEHVIHDERFS